MDILIRNTQYTANLIIIIIGIACLTSGNSLVEEEKPSTIYNMMTNDDKHICSAIINFINSTDYVQERCNIIRTVTVNNFDAKKKEEYLCLAIFDAMSKVCQAGTRQYEIVIPDKNVQQQINNERDDVDTKSLIFNHEYCNDIAKFFDNMRDNTKHYLEDLAKALQEKKFGCMLLCADIDDMDKINPLCVVLHMLHQMIDTAVSHPITEKKISHENLNAPPVVSNNTMEIKNNVKVDAAKMIPENVNKKEGKIVSKEINVNSNNNNDANKKNLDGSIQSVQNEPKISNELPLNKTMTVISKNKPKNELNLDKSKHIKIEEVSTVKVQKMSSKAMVEVDNIGVSVTGNVDINKQQLEENYKNNKMAKDDTKKTEEQVVDFETSLKTEPFIPKQEDTLNKFEDRLSIGDKPDDDDDDVDNQDYNGIKNDDEDSHANFESEKNDQTKLTDIETQEIDADSSHIFLYFTMMSLGCIILYVMYLSKQKILATFAKLRRSRNRNRRRPSTANYRKLDCTLEEAVTSQCNANVTHVIY